MAKESDATAARARVEDGQIGRMPAGGGANDQPQVGEDARVRVGDGLEQRDRLGVEDVRLERRPSLADVRPFDGGGGRGGRQRGDGAGVAAETKPDRPVAGKTDVDAVTEAVDVGDRRVAGVEAAPVATWRTRKAIIQI